MPNSINIENAHLLPGLFKERADVNRAYLMELTTENLLQNFYLEAGVRTDRDVTEMHLGWESPTCQLRGHFLGHWLSAAAALVAQNNDRELKAKLECVIDGLERCQKLNGGRWIGSVPEKYFEKLEKNEYVWSPQYTLHKTLLGLWHSALYAKSEKALALLSNAADWYIDWTADMARKNPHAVYSGEEGGMLEVWAGLYELTRDERYLTLAERYSRPSIFTKLENGGDPLSNCHANASVPWAHGAAKMYEITGEERWLGLVKRFWKCAAADREAFCTGGQNSGEFWIPPHKLGAFMGERTQEFCTVYNMVRLADYLFRFTGESAYLDYIEKNLYNGFLAQQNKYTGMPAYFLPMKAGGVKKWGSKTRDFLLGYHRLKREGEKYGIRVYAGAELRFDGSPNDYLLYGFHDELLADPERVMSEGLEAFAPKYRADGALLIQAHPFRNKCTPAPAELLDGVEVLNLNPRHDSRNDLALAYAEEHHLLMTAGSDCHRPGDEGTTGILAETLPEDSFGYADLIRSGKYTLIRPE